MNPTYELSIEVSEPYDFSKEGLPQIEQNRWVKNQWPLVYFIQNAQKKIAYVGESTNAASRIKNHLANPERRVLTTISIIGSDKFNKSATLDIESQLIQYLFADSTYSLQNGNYGMVNHNYYQQDLYKNLFKEIWQKLLEKKIVTKSLKEIENTDFFKYSPYKSLNEDQYNSILEILNALTKQESATIFVKGSAGTGKTILATYLMKLLATEVNTEEEEYNEFEIKEINYIRSFRRQHPNAKIGLVIAMTSLRTTLQNVFRKIPGLKSSMVISPSDTFKLPEGEKYDLLLVDEAHRLRKYKNIGWLGAFKKNNERLNLDTNGTELDWILANSKSHLFFYDAAQSVKPSDVDEVRFKELLSSSAVTKLELKSQMRVKGGTDYISFVDELLNVRRTTKARFHSDKYDLLIFDSFRDLYSELEKKERKMGLCRLIAGYAWPWKSDPKKKPVPSPDTTDIELDGLTFKWNSVPEDWINSPNAFHEVGCLHTTQGYDLNYAGIIFGKEIIYNEATQTIEIISKNYHDAYGKQGVSDLDVLKAYIINIYKTIMFRGIRGTYIYACDPALREYLKSHIASYRSPFPFREIPLDSVRPYLNSVPLIDIKAAAGNFSHLQIHSDCKWVELPHITPQEGHFICKVEGESMNKVIPNGSYCLFKAYTGGSRNGLIVLVQSTEIQDADLGSGYTVKEYFSEKKVDDDSWVHQTILLKPKSNDPSFKEIALMPDNLESFRVVGVFQCVL